MQFPPQFQLFFQNTYSDQIFSRFRTVWTSIFAFGAKKQEKATINENIEILNFSVLCAKLHFPQKSNFPSKTLFLTNSFADSELVGLVWLRLAPKSKEKQTLTRILRLLYLASGAPNCKLYHKSNFSSKTHILTESFADSELFGL